MKLRNDFEVVGDVRGKGLMIGLELVKDKVREDNNSLQPLSLSLFLSLSLIQGSRAPLPPEEVFEIWDYCKDNGLLVGRGGLYGTVSDRLF